MSEARGFEQRADISLFSYAGLASVEAEEARNPCYTLPAECGLNCSPSSPAHRTDQEVREHAAPADVRSFLALTTELLPLNPGIEAWNPLAPISITALDLHLPDCLRTAVLCCLIDDAGGSRAPGRFAELNVPVR